MADTSTSPGAPAAAAQVPAARAVTIGPMQSKIEELLRGAKLGNTEEGQAWCLKALHPADVNVQVSPCPVSDTKPYASVAFNQMDTMQIPMSFGPGTWNLEIHMLRDPLMLFSWKATQGLAHAEGFVYNKQYDSMMGGPTTYEQAFVIFRSIVEKFRLSSQSLTGYFDAASTSDQGHVVAIQTELPRITMPATPNPKVNDTGAHVMWTWYQDPIPTLENALQTSRAYQGKANEGFYVPSKLGNVGAWTLTNQSYGLLGSRSDQLPALSFGNIGGTTFEADEAFADFIGTFPYTSSAGYPGPRLVFGQPDTTLTSIYYTGLAATSTVRLTSRWTMDLVVRPGTVYAPFVRMPPKPDDLAIAMYHEVSRRMGDAYPSSYNNLAALLPIIANLGKMILPKLASFLPGFIADKVSYARREGKPTIWGAFAPSVEDEVSNRLRQDKIDRMKAYADNRRAAGEIAEADYAMEAVRGMTLAQEQAMVPANELASALGSAGVALGKLGKSPRRARTRTVYVEAPRTRSRRRRTRHTQGTAYVTDSRRRRR